MPDPDRTNDNRANDTKALTPLLLMGLVIVVGTFLSLYFGHAPVAG
jgi:hypothetical protein